MARIENTLFPSTDLAISSATCRVGRVAALITHLKYRAYFVGRAGDFVGSHPEFQDAAHGGRRSVGRLAPILWLGEDHD